MAELHRAAPAASSWRKGAVAMAGLVLTGGALVQRKCFIRQKTNFGRAIICP